MRKIGGFSLLMALTMTMAACGEKEAQNSNGNNSGSNTPANTTPANNGDGQSDNGNQQPIIINYGQARLEAIKEGAEDNQLLLTFEDDGADLANQLAESSVEVELLGNDLVGASAEYGLDCMNLSNDYSNDYTKITCWEYSKRRGNSGFKLNPNKLLLSANTMSTSGTFDIYSMSNQYCQTVDGVRVCGSVPPVNNNLDIIPAASYFSFNLDGNYSCLSSDDRVQLIKNGSLLSFENFVSNNGLIDDSKDNCLAALRTIMQQWLDDSLGHGMATINEGDIFVLLSDLYNKTTIKFTVNKDIYLTDSLDLRDNTNLDVKVIEERFGNNEAAMADFQRVKRLILPAGIVVDYDGRLNGQIEINLGRFSTIRRIWQENSSYEKGKLISVDDIQYLDNHWYIYFNKPVEILSAKLNLQQLFAEKGIEINNINGDITKQYSQDLFFDIKTGVQFPLTINIPANVLHSQDHLTNDDLTIELGNKYLNAAQPPEVLLNNLGETISATLYLDRDDESIKVSDMLYFDIAPALAEGDRAALSDKLKEMLKTIDSDAIIDSENVEKMVGGSWAVTRIKIFFSKDIKFEGDILSLGTLKKDDVYRTITTGEDQVTTIPMTSDVKLTISKASLFKPRAINPLHTDVFKWQPLAARSSVRPHKDGHAGKGMVFSLPININDDYFYLEDLKKQVKVTAGSVVDGSTDNIKFEYNPEDNRLDMNLGGLELAMDPQSKKVVITFDSLVGKNGVSYKNVQTEIDYEAIKELNPLSYLKDQQLTGVWQRAYITVKDGLLYFSSLLMFDIPNNMLKTNRLGLTVLEKKNNTDLTNYISENIKTTLAKEITDIDDVYCFESDFNEALSYERQQIKCMIHNLSEQFSLEKQLEIVLDGGMKIIIPSTSEVNFKATVNSGNKLDGLLATGDLITIDIDGILQPSLISTSEDMDNNECRNKQYAMLVTINKAVQEQFPNLFELVGADYYRNTTKMVLKYIDVKPLDISKGVNLKMGEYLLKDDKTTKPTVEIKEEKINSTYQLSYLPGSVVANEAIFEGADELLGGYYNLADYNNVTVPNSATTQFFVKSQAQDYYRSCFDVKRYYDLNISDNY